MTPNDLRFAVMAGDAKAISKAQGIGKKTAEKLILELKDKLKLSDTIGQETDAPSVPGNEEGAGRIQNEAVEALTALGYGSTEAFQAVRNVEIHEDSTVEDVLKQALRRWHCFNGGGPGKRARFIQITIRKAEKHEETNYYDRNTGGRPED